ncbi:hypothetical protein [Bosea sp. 124]|uniref:hypothetical protein n=1 Tax=Bosea sp. 124 TaxID=2135642 RepID=UPI0020C1108E|nr:hypothetical protein [Bosea sp. 124]
MGRFRHRALHVEMEHRFRAACAFFCQPPPAGIAHARLAIAGDAVAHKLDIDLILVSRPVALEIVEEARPVEQKPMRIEIAQREGKTVVDADQYGRILGHLLHQPFGDALAGPVFARAWRRRHLPDARRPRQDRHAGP